jgi:hypothetical protein
VTVGGIVLIGTYLIMPTVLMVSPQRLSGRCYQLFACLHDDQVDSNDLFRKSTKNANMQSFVVIF